MKDLESTFFSYQEIRDKLISLGYKYGKYIQVFFLQIWSSNLTNMVLASFPHFWKHIYGQVPSVAYSVDERLPLPQPL